jgi:hypothetical protein
MRRIRIEQDERPLAEVVDQQRRQDKAVPGDADWTLAEVTHVGVERFAAGNGQHHRAQHREPAPSVHGEEAERPAWVHRHEHARHLHDPDDAEHDERHKPGHHDRPEQDANDVRSEALHHEQPDDDRKRDRQHERSEGRCLHRQPFDRAQHRDGGRDHAVAIQQRRAEDAEQHQEWASRREGRRVARWRLIPSSRQHERGERQDASFAVVVGVHHDGDVLQRHDDDERPDDQRQHAEHVAVIDRYGVRAVKTLADGV